MNNKDLVELLKYSNSKSILIVTHEGKLRELKCPFKIKVIKDIGVLKKGDVELVESVKITIKIITVYIIKDKAYFYYYFIPML